MTSFDGATRGPNRVEHIGRRRFTDSRDEIADGLSRLLSDTYDPAISRRTTHRPRRRRPHREGGLPGRRDGTRRTNG